MYKYTDPDGRENAIEDLGNDVTKLPDLKPKLVEHLLRSRDSYNTVDGQNKDLRGKDLLIIENKSNGKSITIRVASITSSEGYGFKDSLAEKDFVLPFDPDCGSKYAPEVFTISASELMPDNLLKINGDKLLSDGTTETNSVPWRWHNTLFWESEGCITAQKGNEDGDFSDVVIILNKCGVTKKMIYLVVLA